MDAVISTPELLEAILLQLDVRTLLTSCPLVSSSWHLFISSSPSLQRALFLLPEPPSPSPRRLNPLLTEHFPQWFQGPDDPQDHIMCRRKNGYPQFSSLALYAGSQSDDNPYLRPAASWRRMLTAQPPVTVLGVFHYGFHYMQFESRSRIHHPPSPGLRMGEFYDLVLRHCATWEVSGFTVMQGADRLSKDAFLDIAARPDSLADDLARLKDQGMQVLLQLFCSSGCFIGHVPEEKYPFWSKCGMVRPVEG